MLDGRRIVVVMPAYRAGRTLEATVRDLPKGVVDDIVLVDDASDDDTVAIARALGLTVLLHPMNRGYGANQKTCYREALARGADVVVMVHPDYQYDPRLVTAMAGMVTSGVYDLVLGSRILGGGALAGGMPWWKYAANRALTFAQNLLLGARMSEYHSGYRAYSRTLLEADKFLASLGWLEGPPTLKEPPADAPSTALSSRSDLFRAAVATSRGAHSAACGAVFNGSIDMDVKLPDDI